MPWSTRGCGRNANVRRVQARQFHAKPGGRGGAFGRKLGLAVRTDRPSGIQERSLRTFIQPDKVAAESSDSTPHNPGKASSVFGQHVLDDFAELLN